MPWTNSPLILYHGCDDRSAKNITNPHNPKQHNINLSLCKAITDFGKGFYTTTNLHQAKNWANLRAKRLKKNPTPKATVIRLEINRNRMAKLNFLSFVNERQTPPNTDFWDLITHCRNNRGSHMYTGNSNYDIIFAPVSLWPQNLVIKDCDQISFHSKRAISYLQNVVIQDQGTPLF